MENQNFIVELPPVDPSLFVQKTGCCHEPPSIFVNPPLPQEIEVVTDVAMQEINNKWQLVVTKRKIKAIVMD